MSFTLFYKKSISLKKVVVLCATSVLAISTLFVSTHTTSLFAQTANTTTLTQEQLQAQINNIPTSSNTGVPEIDEQLSVNVSPENPAPNTAVTITVEAYGININAATFEWFVNGKSTKKGTGLNTFSINSGKAGVNTTVRLVLTAATGKVSIREINIRPQNVGIIYESRSYTPPFYKGRSLYSPQGNLIFFAVPNLIGANKQQLDPSTLIYKWTVNGEVQGSDSGYGRSTYSFTGPTLNSDSQIEVEVTSKDGTVSGDASVTVSPENPFSLLYEKRPLLGILFNQALGKQTSLASNEFVVEAFPYFFDVDKKDSSNLEYSWSLNGNGIAVPANQNKLILRNNNGQSGQSSIDVTVNNKVQFLQSARSIFALLFGQNSNATSF